MSSFNETAGSGVYGGSARCHMLQQAGRKHVYVEIGDARPLMRYAPRCLRALKHSTLSYTVNFYGVCGFLLSLPQSNIRR